MYRVCVCEHQGYDRDLTLFQKWRKWVLRRGGCVIFPAAVAPSGHCYLCCMWVLLWFNLPVEQWQMQGCEIFKTLQKDSLLSWLSDYKRARMFSHATFIMKQNTSAGTCPFWCKAMPHALSIDMATPSTTLILRKTNMAINKPDRQQSP